MVEMLRCRNVTPTDDKINQEFATSVRIVSLVSALFSFYLISTEFHILLFKGSQEFYRNTARIQLEELSCH